MEFRMTRAFSRIAARAILVPTALLFLVAPSARSQENSPTANGTKRDSTEAEKILAKETYVRPPAEIERLVSAPRHKNVSLSNQSPDRRHFLRMQSEGLPSVQAFGKPHYYFAGLQVDFKANRARSLTTRGAAGLETIDATTGKGRVIETPKGATVSSPAWSPDGSKLAYI